MNKLLRSITALFSRPRLDQELDEEMQLHVERLTQQFREDGHTDIEARRLALVEFGAYDPLREEARDARGLRVLDELVRDVKYGMRMLLKRPVFTVIAGLYCGLGLRVLLNKSLRNPITVLLCLCFFCSC